MPTPNELSLDEVLDEAERLMEGPQELRRLAIPLLESAARRGDSESAYRLGMMYLIGELAVQSDDEAYKWLLLAANAGDSVAACRVADLSFDGRGTQRNASAAASWYLRAAQAGEEEAFLPVALCFLDGDGFKRSERDATKWLERAYRAGCTDSRGKRLLGDLLVRGVGASPNASLGRSLLREAESEGDEEAKRILKQLASGASPP